MHNSSTVYFPIKIYELLRQISALSFKQCKGYIQSAVELKKKHQHKIIFPVGSTHISQDIYKEEKPVTVEKYYSVPIK